MAAWIDRRLFVADLKRRLMYLLAAQCVTVHPALARIQPSLFLTLGGKAEAPKGYLAMCAETPRLCDDDPLEGTLAGADKDHVAAPIGATAAILVASHARADQPRTDPMRARQSHFTITVPDATLRQRFGSFVVAAAPHDATHDAAADAADVTAPFRYTLDPIAISASQHHDAVAAHRAEALDAASVDVPTASPGEDQRLLQRVNLRVNRIVRQATDRSIYGREEVWQRSGADAGAAGDCEDMALEKQAELIAAGFPKNHLSLAVVYAPVVGLHTVLVARTRDGDQVLDSRSPYLKPWWKSGYSWLSVQSFAGSKSWRQPVSDR